MNNQVESKLDGYPRGGVVRARDGSLGSSLKQSPYELGFCQGHFDHCHTMRGHRGLGTDVYRLLKRW